MIRGKSPLQSAINKLDNYFAELEKEGIFTNDIHREYVLQILEEMDVECQNFADYKKMQDEKVKY